MVETQKSPDIKKEISQPNGAELPHIAEVRKLDGAAKRIQDIKIKQEVARGNKLQEGEREDAADMLLQGFNSEPGTLSVSQKPKENFVENSEIKDERELNGARDIYSDQLKSTYLIHISELKDKPEEQKKTGQEYLGRCIKDLKINSGAPGEDDVRLIATSLPDAWKQTLLDSKSAANNPELKKMREVILERVADGAASIIRSDFDSDKEYKDALGQNFEDITGVKLDTKKAQELLDINSQTTNQTPSEARLAGALSNTLGKQFNGNPETRSWDDVGAVPEIGVCSENFPTTPEGLQSALSSIRGEEGISESKNPGKIREYHAAAGLNAGPSTPWCMSFVQYMSRKYLGYNGPKTASARDGLNMGNKINTPEPGSIVITRGSGPSGCHIGISVGNGEYISGNSGNAVKTKKIPSGSQFRSLQKGLV